MISHHYKCVFVHIPKTAGQSVEQVFLSWNNLTWNERAPLLLRYNDVPERGPQSLAHLFAAEYVSLGYLSQRQFDSYFKFSFVRNPWDRIVSEYYHHKFYKKYSFRDFLLNHFPNPTSRHPYLDLHRHIVPQHRYLYTKMGIQLVNFVGKFEHMQASFDEICRLTGLPKTIIPRRNISTERNRDYRSYYDDECRRFVEAYYREDIQLFQYKF